MAAKAFAFLRAEEFRRLASIKCFHSAGGAKCLRAGVKAACAEIAPYASPPQLTLALRGYEPLAVLEDIASRSSEFLANPDPEALLRVRLIAPLHGADIFSTSFTMSFCCVEINILRHISTPSTRRLLDGVVVRVSHRSIQSRREMSS